MTQLRYFALDDDDTEESGYEAGPIEVAAENLQYDLEEEDAIEPERSAKTPAPAVGSGSPSGAAQSPARVREPLTNKKKAPARGKRSARKALAKRSSG